MQVSRQCNVAHVNSTRAIPMRSIYRHLDDLYKKKKKKKERIILLKAAERTFKNLGQASNNVSCGKGNRIISRTH